MLLISLKPTFHFHNRIPWDRFAIMPEDDENCRIKHCPKRNSTTTHQSNRRRHKGVSWEMNDNLRRAGGFHSAPLSSKGTLTVGTIAPRTIIFLPTPKPPLHWRSDTCGLDYTGRPIQSHQLQKKHVVVKWQNTVSMTMPGYSSVNCDPGCSPRQSPEGDCR